MSFALSGELVVEINPALLAVAVIAVNMVLGCIAFWPTSLTLLGYPCVPS
jgi:hypothetical protein